MFSEFKSATKTLLSAMGYELRKRKVSDTRNSIGDTYALLRGLGFQPNVVIDIGVAYGTPELYDNFRESFFLLVEALPKFEPDLKAILTRHRGSYVLAALGTQSGQVSFNVHDDHLEGSSLYKEMMGPAADGHTISVPMLQLDELLREKALNGPYLLKVDVQGAELDVLEGGQAALRESEVVVLEVSMFEFMKGAPQFFDIVSYMKQHGFAAFDIILGWNRPLDNALGQIDIVFVKENGRFRQNHAYAS
jgi:FkbM family methyltransferase